MKKDPRQRPGHVDNKGVADVNVVDGPGPLVQGRLAQVQPVAGSKLFVKSDGPNTVFQMVICVAHTYVAAILQYDIISGIILKKENAQGSCKLQRRRPHHLAP